jgi:segregation and condensation protein B
VYTTSKSFMDYFGINSSEDLPKLREVFAENLVEPTVMNQEESTAQEEPLAEEVVLIVSEKGELMEHEDDVPSGDETSPDPAK